MSGFLDPAKHGAVDLGNDVMYSWSRCDFPDDVHHVHTIDCLWVWHKCTQALDPENWMGVGWHPAGVGAHTLIQVEPLTITASVYWPACCGMHGFITDGAYQPV